MTDLHALIEKLEQATGPSRELNREIGSALGYVAFDICTDLLGNPFGSPEDAFPNFTGSIDAALPGESIRKVERIRSNGGKAVWMAVQDGVGIQCGFEGYGSSEPLARRIAALRARLSTEDKP